MEIKNSSEKNESTSNGSRILSTGNRFAFSFDLVGRSALIKEKFGGLADLAGKATRKSFGVRVEFKE